jgi:hypothetical protein
MSRDSTIVYVVAQAIDNLWQRGSSAPEIHEIAVETFKGVPPSKPLKDIIRSNVGAALRVLAELGRLGHAVTPYYYKLPVRNRARLIPPDGPHRRKCVPLAAGPKGTAGVRKVETKDDPLLLEFLEQTKVMTAGSVKEFENKQRQANESGLLTKLLADVREPAWFEQALLVADPQLSLAIDANPMDGEPGMEPA